MKKLIILWHFSRSSSVKIEMLEARGERIEVEVLNYPSLWDYQSKIKFVSLI